MAADTRIVDDWSGGVGWIADPDETMARASHAFVGNDGVWLVDPVDMDGLDAALDDLGEVAGVLVTLGRHTRDAPELARRHDVAVHFPEGLLSQSANLDVATATIEPFLQETAFELLPVLEMPGWREYALYDPHGGTVRIPEAVGTAPYFLAPNERLGVNPALRLVPPRSSLGHVAAHRVLVGHGSGIMADGTAALQAALQRSRRNAPVVYGRGLTRLPRVFFEWLGG